MTTHRHEETLSATEARDVFELAARRAGAAQPRVEDVAETLNLDVTDVQELLTEVRARPVPTKVRPNHLPYLGWAIAALALGWIALHPRESVLTPVAAPVQPVAPGMIGPVGTPLQQVAVVPLDLSPPEGYDIGVKANGVVLNLAGRRDVRPKSSADAARRLTDAIALLTQRAEEIGASRIFEGGRIAMPDDDLSKMSVWVNGPGGNVSFDLPVETHTGPASITTLKVRRESIQQSVAGLFAATGQTAGPETGVVGQYFPPSGFQVEFRGRRTAGMNSTPLATEPLDEAAASQRMFLAMRSMMDADLKPVEGRWRQDAATEMKLKTPDESRFIVDTIDGRFEFTVPTKPGTPRREQDRVLHEKATEAVREYIRRGREGR